VVLNQLGIIGGVLPFVSERLLRQAGVQLRGLDFKALLIACGSSSPDPGDPGSATSTATGTTTAGTGAEGRADVVSVTVAGDAQEYTLAVGILSYDLGCERYADWWEVVSPSGELLYRRILDHSHVDEQPFVRDGGPVTIDATDEVVIRAHLSPDGFVGDAFGGTVEGGFSLTVLEADFAADLEEVDPLPEGCLF
jgi:hypothetical protein